MEVEQESIDIDVSKEEDFLLGSYRSRLHNAFSPLLFPTLTQTVSMQGKYKRVCAPCRYPANRMNFGPPPIRYQEPQTVDQEPNGIPRTKAQHATLNQR